MKSKLNSTLFSSFILAACTLFLLPSTVQAFTYNKNNIISDKEMTNDKALSQKSIESFLKGKGSVLAGHKTTDVNGKNKLVSQIIYDTAKRYDLNPMLFLVMAQKESGAVTSSKMTYSIDNWILGYGRCDSCSEAQASKYRGIAKQFDSAGKQFREGYLNDLETRGYTVSGWGVGRTKTTADGIQVTPENKATAALYTYNPWVGAYGGGDRRYGANSLFARLWDEWNPEEVEQIVYPDGSLLQIGSTVYLIDDGKKRPFTSRGALMANYDPREVIVVPESVGNKYKRGTKISYPNYSLIRSPKGTVYLIDGNQRRGFASMAAFRAAGFNYTEILDAEWRDINAYKEGKAITTSAKYPGGALIQNASTGAVAWLSADGKTKTGIPTRDILDNRFGNSGKSIIPVSKEEWDSYKHTAPMKLQDGTLVAADGYPSVYLISNGEKRPFASREAFDALGYKWENIVWVDDSTMKQHPKGSRIKLGSK